MSKVVNVLKPVLFAFIASREVKQLVVDILSKYAKTTDNDVDDALVNIVRTKLLG
jgi:hypothetical protein